MKQWEINSRNGDEWSRQTRTSENGDTRRGRPRGLGLGEMRLRESGGEKAEERKRRRERGGENAAGRTRRRDSGGESCRGWVNATIRRENAAARGRGWGSVMPPAATTLPSQLTRARRTPTADKHAHTARQHTRHTALGGGTSTGQSRTTSQRSKSASDQIKPNHKSYDTRATDNQMIPKHATIANKQIANKQIANTKKKRTTKQTRHCSSDEEVGAGRGQQTVQ